MPDTSAAGSVGEATWPRVRQAIQTTIAACLSYLVTDAFGLPQGFWAVMTAILVTQANVGASLAFAMQRLGGSLLGVLVGGAVAVALADAHELRFAGLAVTVLVLAFFAAQRPALRIACVTAAIVILGDPSVSTPVASAINRMLEVSIGSVIAIATTLFVFPSRAGNAYAQHVSRSIAPLFQLLDRTLEAALGTVPLSADEAAGFGERIRKGFASGNALAKEARLEVAGHIADSPDPESIQRALRRLWHTEIMLLRAVQQPLPSLAVELLSPDIAALKTGLDSLAVQLAGNGGHYTPPDLSDVEVALAEIEHKLEHMRASGQFRAMTMDEVIRLMAFDFALGQLRLNLRDLADRSAELDALAGTTLPFLRPFTHAFHLLRAKLFGSGARRGVEPPSSDMTSV
ncbi:FUSC family protein [Hyphomicrobium sp. D-2]|uniref:FUSC family protein n=1 Tax=Hyphomicrobium sp. D-2 TaxID=3041621 RepID=UPI00245878A8|nr:FUSC family protein [Hyphomicrobium sp. D-2]MDH4983939.1 FUSC family protein [Hyphomicrobium sp. D-2]